MTKTTLTLFELGHIKTSISEHYHYQGNRTLVLRSLLWRKELEWLINHHSK